MAPKDTDKDRDKDHAPYTRIDNMLNDFVIPHLNEGETKCLLYVSRRTDGFGKTWDRIALSQFENGITSGGYPLDCGTEMSRPSLIKALKSLVEKGLVVASAVCPQCFWRGPTDDAKLRCGRCGNRCEKAYQLGPINWQTVVNFLNQYDKKGRFWTYDKAVGRFKSQAGEGQAPHLEITRETLAEFANEVWYPEELRTIVKQARKSVGGRELKNDFLLRHFLQPMLQLQERATPNPGALKYALRETIQRNIAGQAFEVPAANNKVSRRVNTQWHRYVLRIVNKELANVHVVNEDVHSKEHIHLPGLERWVNDLLSRSKTLNEHEETDAARALLSEMLGKTHELSELVGSTERADALIRYAYKIGERDFLGARENTDPVYDYYPEWSWPEGLDD